DHTRGLLPAGSDLLPCLLSGSLAGAKQAHHPGRHRGRNCGIQTADRVARPASEGASGRFEAGCRSAAGATPGRAAAGPWTRTGDGPQGDPDTQGETVGGAADAPGKAEEAYRDPGR